MLCNSYNNIKLKYNTKNDYKRTTYYNILNYNKYDYKRLRNIIKTSIFNILLHNSIINNN